MSKNKWFDPKRIRPEIFKILNTNLSLNELKILFKNDISKKEKLIQKLKERVQDDEFHKYLDRILDN